jgi:hypothetical protein
MKKKNIAESIIIGVGGGIRAISREPIETPDIREPADTESDLEKSEDVHSFRSELGSTATISKDKNIT